MAGCRGDAGNTALIAQEGMQFEDILRKMFGVAGAVPQRAQGHLVRSRCAAKAQVDAPRVQRFQRSELLGDLQRGVVGQHDAARAEPDGGGLRGHVRDEDTRRRGGNGAHVVVLGVPDAIKSQGLRMPGYLDARSETLGHGLVRRDPRQIQNRYRSRHDLPQLLVFLRYSP